MITCLADSAIHNEHQDVTILESTCLSRTRTNTGRTVGLRVEREKLDRGSGLGSATAISMLQTKVNISLNAFFEVHFVGGVCRPMLVEIVLPTSSTVVGIT